ncbi:MAG: hypothetical protein KAJ53_02820 [Anaerolineales bacterium]|nr:hypothetical protein [Anaerolineales bacterium]
MITLSTNYYRDFSPSKPITKLLNTFYCVNGIIVLLVFFDEIRRIRQWEIGDHLEGDDRRKLIHLVFGYTSD